MSSPKIVTIVGARPQFIKASAVSAVLAATPRLQEVLVHTGQHFDANMSAVFFDELEMRPPDHCCDIHGGSHGEMTGRMLIDIERILRSEAPDAVLVYGDTNSTLAGALAAVKLGIPLAHVEAGLRSMNMAMPEEINRILTDRISQWLFAPTSGAAAHLSSEGVAAQRIHVVGDVMFDLALRHGARSTPESGLLGALSREHGIGDGRYCLATIHRAESTSDPRRLRAIVEALIRFACEVQVILPLHPRTRQTLGALGLLEHLAAGLVMIDPIGYRDMVQLEKYAALIATDSGGVQKEAFFHQVPCVTLREETEWVELIDAGWNRLADPGDASAIAAAMRAALGTLGTPITPYGNGKAAETIVSCMARYLD